MCQSRPLNVLQPFQACYVFDPHNVPWHGAPARRPAGPGSQARTGVSPPSAPTLASGRTRSLQCSPGASRTLSGTHCCRARRRRGVGRTGKAAPSRRALVARARSGPRISGGTPDRSLGCQSRFRRGRPWGLPGGWQGSGYGSGWRPSRPSPFLCSLCPPNSLGHMLLPQCGRGLGPPSCGGEQAGEELAGGAGSAVGAGRGPYPSEKSRGAQRQTKTRTQHAEGSSSPAGVCLASR